MIGVLFGAGLGLAVSVRKWIPEIQGLQGYGRDASFWSLESLRGLRQAVAAMASLHSWTLLNLFIRIMMFNPGTGHPVPYLISMLITMSLLWFVLFRFGLLSLMLGYTVAHLLRLMPLTFDLTSWYGYVTLLTTVGIAVWGFRAALVGRPLFRDEILEAETKAR